MSNRNQYDLDETDPRYSSSHGRSEDWRIKGRRFLRYLATRNMECWGFFAAGFLIATIF